MEYHLKSPLLVSAPMVRRGSLLQTAREYSRTSLLTVNLHLILTDRLCSYEALQGRACELVLRCHGKVNLMLMTGYR